MKFTLQLLNTTVDAKKKIAEINQAAENQGLPKPFEVGPGGLASRVLDKYRFVYRFSWRSLLSPRFEVIYLPESEFTVNLGIF